MNAETKLALALLAVIATGLGLIATGCGLGTGKLNFGLGLFGFALSWAALRVLETLTPRR